MPRWFRKKKEEIAIDEQIHSGPYVPPPKRPNQVQTANVPPDMEPIFSRAEELVARYFDDMHWDPTKGTIVISRDRYMLLSCESFRDITLGLSDALQIPEERANVLYYRMAKLVGQADARRFHYTMELRDPIEKLSTGPIHFAYTGNAFVSLLPSNPVPSEEYLLMYDHPQSFEADVRIRKFGSNSKFPVCHWNCGYSAGWCSESFGLDLDAQEIHCRAKGDKNCRFVMAPKSRLEQRIAEAYKNGF